MGIIASSIANQMAAKQKEMQREMQAIQTSNMLINQERMRRMQIAFQMAMARERLWWMGSTYAVACSALAIRALRKKPIPPVAIVPVFTVGVIIAYQWDFAYGQKITRVNNMANEIMSDDQWWFVPIMPDPKKVEILKDGRINDHKHDGGKKSF